MALFTLEKIQPRVISFEEQVSSLRQHLAQMYERQELWKQVRSNEVVVSPRPPPSRSVAEMAQLVTSRFFGVGCRRSGRNSLGDGSKAIFYRLQTGDVFKNRAALPRRRRSYSGRGLHQQSLTVARCVCDAMYVCKLSLSLSARLYRPPRFKTHRRWFCDFRPS